jgi:hypothetical protein
VRIVGANLDEIALVAAKETTEQVHFMVVSSAQQG